MTLNVKNTIIQSMLDILAPHYCYSCGKIGKMICEHCKYDIETEALSLCLVCKSVTEMGKNCKRCSTSYTRAWCCDQRGGLMKRVLDAYKFEYASDAHEILAGMLARRIGQLPSSVVVVPIPTISAHIRQRGYDHALLLAQTVARINTIECRPILRRATSTRQLGASRKQRVLQAKKAFIANQKCDQDKIYLIIDDIATTGSTLEYAARTLYDAGASEVWVAVVAAQTLD